MKYIIIVVIIIIIKMLFLFIYFYFEQYLFRGALFSKAGLNGALMKRKNNTKNNNR